MYECQICGETFKSSQGLSGHRRLSHGEIAKANSPDEHLLSATLVSTLDNLGEHKELIATLQANMAAIDTRLDEFQRSLTPPDGHNPPSLALVSAWENCPDCGPKWIELKELLWQRFHDEKLAALKALNEHSQEAEAEHSKEAEAEHSEHSEDLPPQRWLVVCPGYVAGFKWADRVERLPGVPDSIECEGYCKVVDDEAEAKDWRGKRGFQVIELPPVEALPG